MDESKLPLNQTIKSLTEKTERKIIQAALRKMGGNKTKTAKKLGISRKTLFNKMSQYKIRD